jgi:hypothetical protein
MSISSTTNRNDYTGNGSVSSYSYTFKITNQSHLRITVRNTLGVELAALTLTTDYTVSGVDETSGGAITLVSSGQSWLTGGNLTSGYKITIRHVVPITQGTDIRNQGDYYPETHEDTFDYLTVIDQQQQDEIDRSAKMPETVSASVFDPTLPAELAGTVSCALITNATGDGFDIGPTAAQIASAQTDATAAAASAAAALVSQGAASTSQTAAAASAASAAAQLASAFFRDVSYKTVANSPLTITSADNGKLFVFDSSGGAIAVSLPQMSTLTPPFNVAFLLKTAGNAVTVSRGSTDTIMGATSKVLSAALTGFQLVADTDASPDDWSAMDFGAAADGSITNAKLAYSAVNGQTAKTSHSNSDELLIADVAGGALKKQTRANFLPSPTAQTFTSGSGTYTTPSGVRWIRVRMAGGGGGGAGSGTAGAGTGGNGGNTTFGSSLLTANGGAGASGGITSGGTGGTVTVSAPATSVGSFQGGSGQGSGYGSVGTSVLGIPGGMGGSTPFAGGGAGGASNSGAGGAGVTNTGAGGGGGGLSATNGSLTGPGGGAGGYVEAIITSPSATYAYAVGAAGTAGTAGTAGAAGGAGGSGVVIVEEFY